MTHRPPRNMRLRNSRTWESFTKKRAWSQCVQACSLDLHTNLYGPQFLAFVKHSRQIGQRIFDTCKLFSLKSRQKTPSHPYISKRNDMFTCKKLSHPWLFARNSDEIVRTYPHFRQNLVTFAHVFFRPSQNLRKRHNTPAQCVLTDSHIRCSKHAAMLHHCSPDGSPPSAYNER